MYGKKRRHTKSEVASYWAGVRAGKRSAGRSRGKPRYKKKRWY